MGDSGTHHDPGGGGLDGGLGDGLGGKQPPAYVVGEGGGPAMPTGGTVTDDEKQTDEDISTVFSTYTDMFWGVCAWSSLGEPEDFEFQGTVCTIAAGLQLSADVLDLLVDDPPQPSYARPVAFAPRVSNPPAVADPALEPFRVCVQQAVFSAVTAQGYLDSIERLQGAIAANDTTWALVHRGVADLARQQLCVDIENIGLALNAAGNAVSGTKYDIPLQPGMGGVKEMLGKSGTKARLTAAMRAAGLTAAEIRKQFAHLASDPKYTGPATTFSRLIVDNAVQVFALAVKLGKQV